MAESGKEQMLRVLVVDDEPGMRSGVARALRDHRLEVDTLQVRVGFAPAEADSAEQALAAMECEPPDILLLDHKLPGQSGMELLESLGGTKADILVIMITAYATLEMAVHATKKGAFDLLAKPFTPDELRASVDKAARHLLLQRQARRLAAERLRVRFQFLSVLAHELKSPLAAIQSYLGVLRDWEVREQPDAYTRIIERCTLRIDGMRKLILDLLDLTRIESGQRQRQFEQIRLDRLAEEVVETFNLQADARRIGITLHTGDAPTMTADRGEIEMVFNNLVSNAVKYNRDGGRVDIHLDCSEGVARLVVQDTGIGMTREETEKLFGEFVRIKNQNTEHILGSGLGLSIVKNIATLYQGGVEVESQPGVGSRFTVRLKSAHSLQAAGAAPPAAG